MLNSIGTPELLIILVIVILLFGGKKLVELARGLGESSKEVKKIGKELTGSDSKEVSEKDV